MAAPEQVRAEEIVRGLANAANAVRLYPPTSPLRDQAVDRFLALAAESVDGTALQIVVEPGGFKWGDAPLAEGQSAVSAFADTLYAHQVGKLIVAPALTAEEVTTFLACSAMDPHEAKDAGGFRAVLKQSGVSRLAVVEVTLRASMEEGLAGIDLTAAPLEEIGPRVVAATAAWAESARSGEGTDEVASAVGALEEAARDLASQRIAEALLRLDEETRIRALAAACTPDAGGKPMAGMLEAIAHMKPAALARLLSLAANGMGGSAGDLLGGLKLPPEAMRAVMLLLTPSSPHTEAARGVPADTDVKSMAHDISNEVESESSDLERQIARSGRSQAAGKALATTVDIASERRTEDAVSAVAEALAPAVRAGAFAEVRAALTYLSSIERDPALGGAASQARLALSDPQLVQSCLASLSTGADPDVVAAILSAGGPTAADGFIAAYISASESLRPRLQQVLRSMGDAVASAASRRIREADTRTAVELIDVLVGIGDKRVLPVLRQALEHLDFGVRKACLEALAKMHGSESERLLVGALNHWDPETRCVAAHEIGEAHAMSAVPAMLKIMQGYYLFERNYGLKKELLMSLEVLGSPAAVPTLRRMANRRFVIGRKNRELRYLARRALAGLEQAGTTDRRAS